MLIDPDQYAGQSAGTLLRAAALGHAGLDRRWLRALLAADNNLSAIMRFALEEHDSEEYRIDLEECLVDLIRHHRAAEGIPYLVRIVRRDPHNIPDYVTEAFAELGAPAVEPLLELFRESSERDAPEILFLLAAIQVRDPRILELLTRASVEDPFDAVLFLGLHGDPTSRPILERMLAGADDEELRAQIGEALASLDGPPAELEPFVIWADYPEESDPVFEVLEEEERLALLSSPRADYRRKAAASFILHDASREVRERLFELANADPDSLVRARSWEALADYVVDPRIGGRMFERLEEASTPYEERAALLFVLAASPSPEVERWIDRFYQEADSRADALRAMWRSLSPAYEPVLVRHLDDPDLAIRRQAIAGVGYMGLARYAARLPQHFSEPALREDALYAFALAAPSELTTEGLNMLIATIDRLAGGLDSEEVELIQTALDERRMAEGLPPLFEAGEDTEED